MILMELWLILLDWTDRSILRGGTKTKPFSFWDWNGLKVLKFEIMTSYIGWIPIKSVSTIVAVDFFKFLKIKIYVRKNNVYFKKILDKLRTIILSEIWYRGPSKGRIFETSFLILILYQRTKYLMPITNIAKL